MSNRYSNRESMRVAQNTGGDKSYSFGASNMGLQSQVINTTEKSKFLPNAKKQQLNPAKKIEQPRVEVVKSFKEDSKNKAAGNNLSLFKKSRKQINTTNSPDSKELSPIHTFKINQLLRKQTDELHKETNSSVNQ